MSSKTPLDSARFAGWSAIVGALLIYVTAGLSTMATGLDTELVFRGDDMLALPAGSLAAFRWAMVTDVFGFYLSFLPVGAWLWHAFDRESAAQRVTGLAALAMFVTLGVCGAALQMAALGPLSDMYVRGTPEARTAAAVSWTTIAHVAQRGLWWFEGPVMAFWMATTGSRLKQAAWGGGSLLQFLAVLVGAFFVSGLFPQLNGVTAGLEMAVVVILPLWMIRFGVGALRRADDRAIVDGFARSGGRP
ncbi:MULTISPECIES: hypothetical protein [Burkholderia]|uniref:Membrane protein n=1 Tax=Burkholderia paludis TaxID=1506587 RepID=A0A6P2Q5P5_9BURK|nr:MULTISPECIES: hypothetical protein [Burkholderia]CAB3769827.1 hypothetical protein LMG30113_06076 [Burkholderia paludis]VWC17045.1 membrane protein [Burkholderia paludis]